MTDKLAQIPHNKLAPWKGNPRQDFDPAEIEELRGTLATVGLVQPLRVRPMKGKAGFYEIVAGERRWRANDLRVKDRKDPTKATDKLPCIVRDIDDTAALEIALVENLERQALHPLDEAQAFERLREAGRSTAQIAKAVNRKVRYVEIRRQYLTRLSPATQAAFRDGDIDATKARMLAMKCEPAQQAGVIAQMRDADSWIETAADLSDFLDHTSLPLRHAIFDPAAYEGPRGADPDALEEGLEADPDSLPAEAVLALDVPAFVALQREALEAEAKKLRESWAWVEIFYPNESGRYFQGWLYKKSQDKKKAGVVLQVMQDWSVQRHEGLVAPTAKSASGAKKAAAAAGDKAPDSWVTHPLQNGFLLAAQQKTEALRRAALNDAEDPPALAMRVAIVALLADHVEGVAIRSHEDSPFKSPAVACVLEPLAAKLGLQLRGACWKAKFEGKTTAEHIARLDKALGALERAELERVFAAVVADRLYAAPRDPKLGLADAPYLRILAEELGVDVRQGPYRLDAPFLESIRRPLLLRCALGTGALAREELAAYAKVKLAEIRALILAITQPGKAKREARRAERPDYLPPCFDFADKQTAERPGTWNPKKDPA